MSSLKIGDSLEIKELAHWAMEVHPRCVADFKPLFLLAQGLLRDIIYEKYLFFSAESEMLKVRTGRARPTMPGSAGDRS